MTAVALGLSGCVVGPNFLTPPAPNVDTYLAPAVAERSEPASKAVPSPGAHLPADWWHVLGSRRLNDLVELGLEYNTDLQAAEAGLRVAEANAMATSGWFCQLRGLWRFCHAITNNAAR